METTMPFTGPINSGKSSISSGVPTNVPPVTMANTAPTTKLTTPGAEMPSRGLKFSGRPLRMKK